LFLGQLHAAAARTAPCRTEPACIKELYALLPECLPGLPRSIFYPNDFATLYITHEKLPIVAQTLHT